MELTRDLFEAFKVSDQATRKPEDLGDWRTTIATNAERNGDAFADANPDTSLTSKYADTSVDEDEAMPDLCVLI